MKESTVGFIIVEACIISLMCINQFFIYTFDTMDLHKESVGKYYNDLVKTRDNIITNSNLMNMILGVIGIWSLSMFILYNLVSYCWKGEKQSG